MRIAVFTESYEPIVNGVSVCVTTLRDELVRRGHDVFIFAPRYEGFKDPHPSVFRWPARHTVLMRDYPFPVTFAPEMRRAFEALKVDVVHTQTPFILGVTGSRWARRLGIPIVSTNHTLYTEYAHYVPVRPRSLTKLVLVKLMKWYYAGCDAVVVPSHPVESILRSYGIKTRIEVIKTGVVAAAPPGPDQNRNVRARHGVAEDGFLLLYVGRIAREKNLEMLLRAFRSVTEHCRRHSEQREESPAQGQILHCVQNDMCGKDVRLLLVGGGPALAETRELAGRLGLTDRLEFLGMLSRPQIDPLYAAADAFVFPSTTETQGIAICEALSAGLPVVAVNAGGIPENIQRGVDGFLTDDDPDQFADRIEFLITHEPERRAMSARARENACSFSIERMVGDVERLYASVIDANRPVPERTTHNA
jgi:glycosyltransferase involved in cell wall biosynthesis